jgi:hypothetical protein
MSAEQKSQGHTPQGLHVLAKPIGPVCDIQCDYCFYLEKHALFGKGENYRMSDDVLAAYIRQYVAAQPTPVVEFVWQAWNGTAHWQVEHAAMLRLAKLLWQGDDLLHRPDGYLF